MKTDQDVAEEFAESFSELMVPSIDIANSAMALAMNRCHDLEIPSIICILLLRELCDTNAKDMIARRSESVNDMLRKKFPQHADTIREVDANVDIHAMLTDMVQALVSEHVSSKQEKIG